MGSLVDKSENSVEAASLTSSEEKEILSRPLRKSKGFHDQELLQQQIKEEEMSGVEVRRKILEEYVQHVYEIKLEHQLELEKGNFQCKFFLQLILCIAFCSRR